MLVTLLVPLSLSFMAGPARGLEHRHFVDNFVERSQAHIYGFLHFNTARDTAFYICSRKNSRLLENHLLPPISKSYASHAF
jgi:hypothetical protein